MKHIPPIPEDELVAALKTRSQKAYSVLYDTYAPSLLGVISRVIKEEDKAEDVLQETFVAIWKNIDTYEAGKERLFTWLLNIARNTARSFGESSQHTGSVNPPVPSATGYPEQPNSLATGSAVPVSQTTTLSGLDPTLRQMIDLIYFEGYSQQKVADNMNMPLGLVQTGTRTALQQLKALFSNAL